MSESNADYYSGPNRARVWADNTGLHWSDGSRVYSSAEVLAEGTPLVHTAGSSDVQAGPRARFLDGARGSVRKPHESIRQQRQFGVIGTVSVSALNVAHYALLAAFDLVREMVESRRRVDGSSTPPRGMGLQVDEFWKGVSALRRKR